MYDSGNDAAPGLVACRVMVSHTIWERHRDRLEKLQRACPHVPVGGKVRKHPELAVAHVRRDVWGCLWHYPGMGLDGQVIAHPLDTWEKLSTWQAPLAAERVEAIKREAAERRSDGTSSWQADLEHGFLFLRLTYLRGFEQFMIDVAEEHPNLYELRDLVADYWYQITKAYLDCGVTHLNAGDDLGSQDRLLIAPQAWRKLIKPAYRRIFGLAREHCATVRLHTDGYVVDILPDLIETGITDLNPQDLVNGLDNLARLAKAQVHISLEIDEQHITAFGSPGQIRAHIKNCIRTLGSPLGGLDLDWTAYPGTPIERIEAVVRAMEAYHDLWVKRRSNPI